MIQNIKLALYGAGATKKYVEQASKVLMMVYNNKIHKIKKNIFEQLINKGQIVNGHFCINEKDWKKIKDENL